MSDFDYDLFVIGGGSGGVRAARVAAGEAGAKVGLAEADRYGGTCVIRGCVPKKLMVFASSHAHAAEEAVAYGWSAREGSFDWSIFHGKLTEELDRLETVYRNLLKGSGVDAFDARARLRDPHTVELSSGEVFRAKHILVSTGGHPVRPDIDNCELGMVSDDIFHLEELPKRILIVGGGYIACEFACILNGLGVKVTQFYRGAQILRGFDGEARGLIADHMRQIGIDLHVGTNIVEMCPDEDAPEAGMGAGVQETGTHIGDSSISTGQHPGKRPGPIRVKGTNGQEQVFDAVFFATGRSPSTGDMGLEEAGVKLGKRGEIVVDQYSQSSVPSVYAIGDVTNRVALTPVAIREGMAFVETVFKGNPTPVDHELIPSAVFTQPEYGSVGITEEEAQELDETCEIYCTSFRPMRTAFAGKPDRVLMKLIVGQESRKVLGCHIVAPEAGELIQLAGVAVKMGATKEDFDRTVAVHPTMSEELVTMRAPVRTA
ncbi:NADPH-glutathione reductase [Poseidonocella pacifica]|uniref:NADPH-glutathione reductase n=1 Tax=Poseidonocella pacifica TaxID=871651 RepID=A0A1I0X414_9RHOB|nr:FAD-dependent oxidoreductase [Poseidonocella pacifica]SFA94793.1 NADPH-glutathione reductase [Poseidonocella pacifica]